MASTSGLKTVMMETDSIMMVVHRIAKLKEGSLAPMVLCWGRTSVLQHVVMAMLQVRRIVMMEITFQVMGARTAK